MEPITIGLKKGHRDKAVGVLQSVLKNYIPGSWWNGRWKPLVVDNDFGNHTEACLIEYQQKGLDLEHLIDIPEDVRKSWKTDEFTASGEVDEKTKWLLENGHKVLEHYDLTDEFEKAVTESKNEYEGNELIETYVKLIHENVGVKEEGRNNRGKKIDEYIEYGSWGLIRKEIAPAWCQLVLAYLLRVIFEMYLGAKGKWKWLKEGIAYTPYNVRKGKELGIAYDIKTKKDTEQIEFLDWLYIRNKRLGRVAHVVQFLGWDKENPDLVICFEGNTNISGSREGDSTMIRRRHWKTFCNGVHILKILGDISKFKKKPKGDEKEYYDSLTVDGIKEELESIKKQYGLEVSYPNNMGKQKLFDLLKTKIKEAEAKTAIEKAKHESGEEAEKAIKN